MDAGWLSQGFEPPTQTVLADASIPKPLPKPPPPAAAELRAAMRGLRSDAELADFIAGRSSTSTTTTTSTTATTSSSSSSKTNDTAVVEFGTQWCAKCHEMFPAFVRLARRYPQHRYAIAQVETMSAAASRGVRFTPTFAIYRGGRKVDEVVGKEPRRLEDRLWLHSD